MSGPRKFKLRQGTRRGLQSTSVPLFPRSSESPAAKPDDLHIVCSINDLPADERRKVWIVELCADIESGSGRKSRPLTATEASQVIEGDSLVVDLSSDVCAMYQSKLSAELGVEKELRLGLSDPATKDLVWHSDEPLELSTFKWSALGGPSYVAGSLVAEQKPDREPHYGVSVPGTANTEISVPGLPPHTPVQVLTEPDKSSGRDPHGTVVTGSRTVSVPNRGVPPGTSRVEVREVVDQTGGQGKGRQFSVPITRESMLAYFAFPLLLVCGVVYLGWTVEGVTGKVQNVQVDNVVPGRNPVIVCLDERVQMRARGEYKIGSRPSGLIIDGPTKTQECGKVGALAIRANAQFAAGRYQIPHSVSTRSGPMAQVSHGTIVVNVTRSPPPRLARTNDDLGCLDSASRNSKHVDLRTYVSNFGKSESWSVLPPQTPTNFKTVSLRIPQGETLATELLIEPRDLLNTSTPSRIELDFEWPNSNVRERLTLSVSIRAGCGLQPPQPQTGPSPTGGTAGGAPPQQGAAGAVTQGGQGTTPSPSPSVASPPRPNIGNSPSQSPAQAQAQTPQPQQAAAFTPAPGSVIEALNDTFDIPLRGGIALPLSNDGFERHPGSGALPVIEIKQAPSRGRAMVAGQFVLVLPNASNELLPRDQDDEIVYRVGYPGGNSAEGRIKLQYRDICSSRSPKPELLVYLPAGKYHLPGPLIRVGSAGATLLNGSEMVVNDRSELRRMLATFPDAAARDALERVLPTGTCIQSSEMSVDHIDVLVSTTTWAAYWQGRKREISAEDVGLRQAGPNRQRPIGFDGQSLVRFVHYNFAAALAAQLSSTTSDTYEVPRFIAWYAGATVAVELTQALEAQPAIRSQLQRDARWTSMQTSFRGGVLEWVNVIPGSNNSRRYILGGQSFDVAPSRWIRDEGVNNDNPRVGVRLVRQP